MKILVLGASGFVGRHTVPLLLAAGHSVVALARRPPAAAPNLQPVAGDALAPGVLDPAIAGCDGVLNLVGIHHGHGAQSFERLHVELADALVRASERAGVRRLVQLSVLCARPDARSAYHDSKHRADERIRQASVPWLVLKPAVIYGADDNFTDRIQGFLQLGVVPMPGGGVGRHAPVHVDDVAAALVRAFQPAAPTGVSLGLCGARTLTYAELVRELAAARQRRPLLVPVPVGLVKLAAASTAWMAEPPISLGQLLMVTEGMAEDTSASWARLDLQARPFAAG